MSASLADAAEPTSIRTLSPAGVLCELGVPLGIASAFFGGVPGDAALRDSLLVSGSPRERRDDWSLPPELMELMLDMAPRSCAMSPRLARTGIAMDRFASPSPVAWPPDDDDKVKGAAEVVGDALEDAIAREWGGKEREL